MAVTGIYGAYWQVVADTGWYGGYCLVWLLMAGVADTGSCSIQLQILKNISDFPNSDFFRH